MLGKVIVDVPDPVIAISAPLTVSLREVVPPETSNPSELFVMSRFTEFCFLNVWSGRW